MSEDVAQSDTSPPKKYYKWLDTIWHLGMRIEWDFEFEDEYWLPKFNRGLSPKQAFDEFWVEYNEERKEPWNS